jgi:Tol biopolymer transport system component
MQRNPAPVDMLPALGTQFGGVMRHHQPQLGILISCLFVCATAYAEESESNFLSETRRLSFEGRRAGEAYWSPNDSKLVFQSERVEGNPFYQIFALDMQTGDSEMISTGLGKTTCAYFSPDGQQILFASTHLDPAAEEKQRQELEFRASGEERRYSWDYDETFDLFIRDLESGELARITDSQGYDAEASFSPDGQWIAFTSMRHGYSEELDEKGRSMLETDLSWFGEIYIMPTAGGEARRLTTTPGYDGGPFFSPDGQRIVWRRFDEEGFIADIWTMELDGSDQQQITDFGCMSWAPYIHPSGNYVFFASNKLGFANFEIYMVDIDGAKEPVRVTYTDRFDGLPVPSHDGKRIAFTSSRHGGDGAQVFLSKWNHEAALRAIDAAPARLVRSEP